MKKEYNFKKAKVNKGPVVRPTKSNKIQKTFRLDEDVFEWLLSESQKKGLPYQTLMNSLLKQLMLQEESLADRVSKLEAQLKMKKSG